MPAAPRFAIVAVEPAAPAPFEPLRISWTLTAGDTPLSGRVFYLSPVVPDAALHAEIEQSVTLDGPEARPVVDLPPGQTTVGVVHGFAPDGPRPGRLTLTFQPADDDGRDAGDAIDCFAVLQPAPAQPAS